MELSYVAPVPSKFLKDFKEELWAGGEMVREAWCTELPEAEPIINDVCTAFPEYTPEKLRETKSNMIGYATNYRPPYSKGCISWYTWKFPSDEQIAQYGISLLPGTRFYQWYGMKFDPINKVSWLKYVFNATATGTVPCPPLPNNSRLPFYAMIADEDKKTLPLVDVYFNAAYEDVKVYCEEHGLIYPAPPPEEEVLTKLWAFVYDINTLEISKVKGYRIFNIYDRTK